MSTSISPEMLDTLLDVLRRHAGSLDPHRFDEFLAQHDEWTFHEALSASRSAAVAWYPLRDGARVLDLNAGPGVLTETWLRRGARVSAVARDATSHALLRARFAGSDERLPSNLTILDGDALWQHEENARWDLVWLDGVPDDVAHQGGARAVLTALLSHTRRRLTGEGRLLWSVDNRFALDALCGLRRDRHEVPFAGLQPYQGVGCLLSRADIGDVTSAAGFAQTRLMMPVPDRHTPEFVLSDDEDGADEPWQRSSPYALDRGTQIAEPTDLIRQLRRNGVMGFFANGYLVEAADRLDDRTPSFATMTLDREPEHAFITAIHRNGLVTKTAAFASGEATLATLKHNLDSLAERGLRVVDFDVAGRTASMPRHAGTTLSAQLASGEAASTADQLYGVFDGLTREIARSSSRVDGGPATWEASAVLSQAYVDMVPFNCFVDGGEFTWFDQEFVLENCPMGYVLFRAVMYSFMTAPRLHALVDIEDVKQRYDLGREWERWSAQERAFVERNRRRLVNHAFTDRAVVDRESIVANRRRLMPHPTQG